MSRPQPLVNLSSAVPTEHHQLTPRTPRTASGPRTSQLEEGFAKVRLTEVTDEDPDDNPSTLQSAPLLTSSSTARFSARERRSPSAKNSRNQLSHSLWAAAAVSPLAAGILIGGLLLFMLILSLMWPGSLHRYLGLESTSPETSAQHNSDSANQSTIPPLHPIEYLKACGKHGYVHHGDYWDTDHDMSPVVANESSIICAKTITYMLDGTVGLAADLALMAQTAALAREVILNLPPLLHMTHFAQRNRTFLVDDTYWNRGKSVRTSPRRILLISES